MSKKCDHIWISMGCSTICDPVVYHTVCSECRIFRHRNYYDSRDGADKDGKLADEWFTTEWKHGPFNLDEFLARYADEIASVKAVKHEAKTKPFSHEEIQALLPDLRTWKLGKTCSTQEWDFVAKAPFIVQQLLDENELMREALEFYSKGKHYKGYDIRDFGEVALEALAAVEVKGEG